MEYTDLLKLIADLLQAFDAERPTHKAFQPGIGPFGEPQIVGELARRLQSHGLPATTKRTPDLKIGSVWAIECKIVRPFGDNGKEAENWSVNLLHPYAGNVSLVGDAIKLNALSSYVHKGLLVIGFEHDPVKISLDPLLESFELIATKVVGIRLGPRIEQKREGLVHREHQVLRCIGWELENEAN